MHRWQVGTDGKTFPIVVETYKACVTHKNLTPGVMHHVRHQTILGDVTSDWSPVLVILVA